MCTQVLVIFIIRTGASVTRDVPHPILTVTTFGALGFAMAVPFLPVASWFGFVTLPWPVLFVIALIIGAYLLSAYYMKRWAMP